jgi:hypothetical protein
MICVLLSRHIPVSMSLDFPRTAHASPPSCVKCCIQTPKNMLVLSSIVPSRYYNFSTDGNYGHLFVGRLVVTVLLRFLLLCLIESYIVVIYLR